MKTSKGSFLGNIYLMLVMMPVLWAKVQNRTYCFRESPDWVVNRIASLDKPKPEDADLLETIRQAQAEQSHRALKKNLRTL